MDISAASWNTLSTLLDEALDIEPAARAAWLDRLSAAQPALAPDLRRLLAAHASPETADLLKALPAFASPLAASASATDFAAGDRIGPYRLLREIGSGGMADVWLADRADGAFLREVALKLPRVQRFRRDLAARFTRERDILARLEHPNVARLYDAGVDSSGLPYLAMEYVAGKTITQYCDERGLDVEERMQLFGQVIDAVQYAHANLVIHRDLKPSNILVTADGEVRLLDFGIAKLLEGESALETKLTQAAGRALTLDYASPEQIKGEPLGTASDVYSLAVVAYELLTGVRPYRLKRKSAAELEEAIASIEPPLASGAARDPDSRRKLRGDLDAILNKALKKDSRLRYPTAEALGQDLHRYLNRHPVLAQPDRLGYRASKFVSRYRLQVAAGSVVMIAMLAGAGVALWQAREARTQAARARTEVVTAQAIQAFIEAVFRANAGDQDDPQKARDTTARQLLDMGTERINAELQDAPEARFALLKTLASMYGDMDLLEKAAELQRQRVAMARQVWGNDSVQTAQALADLANAQVNLEQIEPALQTLADAAAILDARHDLDSSARFSVDVTLASAYRRSDPAKAMNAADRAVANARARPASAGLVKALTLQAEGAIDIGRLDQAQVAMIEAIKLVEARPELGRTRLGDLYGNLGEVQAYLGELDAAAASFRRALEIEQGTAGTSPLRIHTAEFRLSNFLSNQGQLRESMQVIRPAYEWARSGQSEIGMVAAMLTMMYGRYLGAYGRSEDSLAVLDEATGFIDGGVAAPELRGPVLLGRAAALLDVGRHTEAAQAVAQAQAIFEAAGTFPDWVLIASRMKRRVQIATGQAAQALLDYEDERRRQAERATARPAPAFLGVMESAQLQLATGALEVAQAQAREALSLIEARRFPHFMQEHEARVTYVLGLALTRQGSGIAALPVLIRSVDLHREVYDPASSLALADALLALAECQRAGGDSGAAARSIEEARRIHGAHKAVGEQHVAPLRRLDASDRAPETSR